MRSMRVKVGTFTRPGGLHFGKVIVGKSSFPSFIITPKY